MNNPLQPERVQRVYRGHIEKLLSKTIKANLIVERTYREYLNWVNPYGNQVYEFWKKEKEDRWNAFMFEQVDKAENQLWEQRKDDDGHLYYYNPDTKETSFDPPPFGAPFKPYIPPIPSLAKAKLHRSIMQVAAQNQYEQKLRV